MVERKRSGSGIVDPNGHEYDSMLLPALDNVAVVSPKLGPISAKKVENIDRRGFFGLVLGVLSAVGGIEGVKVGIDARDDARDKDLEAKVRADLETVFPFLFRSPASVCFHPNGDNQRLLAVGISQRDASVLDHLVLHKHRLPIEVRPDPFAPGQALLESPAPDLDIFSYTTLAQAHSLRAMMMGEPRSEERIQGTNLFVRNGFQYREPNVVVGSPTGNRVSAFLHGKYRRREKGRERELVHVGVPGLHLPYEFSLDADFDPSVRDRDGRYVWQILKSLPSGTREHFAPMPGGRDYLLLSVLPNHAAPDFNSTHPVLLLEGCTAIGTSGVELLLAPTAANKYGLLRDLAERVTSLRARYWQALFRITGTAKRENLVAHTLGRQDIYATTAELLDVVEVNVTDQLANHHARICAAFTWGSTQLGNR
jgi:hypothetical protein